MRNTRDLIDVNVFVSKWPFRLVPSDDPAAMVKKLKGRHVIQAWVGSFNGLFHRDLAGINERLMETCTMHVDGILVSFGSHYPYFLHESASLKLQENKLVEPRLKPITIESSRRLIGSAT